MARAKRNKDPHGLKVTFTTMETSKVFGHKRVTLFVQRANGTTEVRSYLNPRDTTRWWTEVVESFPATVQRKLNLKGGYGQTRSYMTKNDFFKPFKRVCEIPLWNTLDSRTRRFWFTADEFKAELAQFGKAL